MAATRQIALMILSLLAAAAHGIGGTTPVINATCAAATRNATHFTGYDYCVRTLSSDPAALSSATDARGLAAAAANLAVVNITSTEQAISMLITSLGGCLSMYREMNGVMGRVRTRRHPGRPRPRCLREGLGGGRQG
jgi:hypothetical protein